MNLRPTERGRDAVSLSILFLMAWAPFLWRWGHGLSSLSDPLAHDVGFQWIPFRLFIERAFSQGLFPLWAEEMFAGFPFAAFSHTAVFYPLSWLLTLLDYPMAVNFYYPLHLFIAGAGVFFLARRAGLVRSAAWFAAAVYIFTGKPYYFIHFLPSAQSNPWMPWFLWAGLGLMEGRGRAWLVAATAGAMMVLGGDVESTGYGLFFGFPLLALIGAERGLPVPRLVLVAAALLPAALLSAVQLLPLAELSAHFVRNQGVTFEYFSQRQLPAAVALAVLVPVMFESGDFILDAPYFHLGLVTFTLALMAGVGRGPGRRVRRAMLALLALALGWSLGSIPLLDRLQYSLPVLRSFGSPEHAFFMAQLILALLAGRGLMRLGELDWNKTALTAIGFSYASFFLLVSLVCFFPEAEFLLFFLVLAILLWLWTAAILIADGIKRSFRPVAVHGLIAAHVGWLWLMAFDCLPEYNHDEYRSSWLHDNLPRVGESGGRFLEVSSEGLADRELWHHLGLVVGADSLGGWITTPVRSFAELMALAEPRAARFKDGRLDYLGLNADLRDGRFIDARSMPILNLLGLTYIVDRGIPLKFSSPYPLWLAPPDYHRRVVKNLNDEETCNYDSGSGHPESITGWPGETWRFRLFVSQGDVLRFRIKSQETAPLTRLSVTVGSGDSVEVLWSDILSGGTASYSHWFESTLGRHAGKEVELVFHSELIGEKKLKISWPRTQEPSSSEKRRPIVRCSGFYLVQPQIVNPKKPLQAMEQLDDLITPMQIYRNIDALPRAFIVKDWEVAPGKEERLARLSEMSAYEFATKAVLEAEPAELTGVDRREHKEGKLRAAKLMRSRPGEKVFAVGGGGPGLLVVADQYYPGWRAFVDGRETRIYRADHALRAVPLAGTDLQVRFVFQPISFRIGLFASLASVLAFIGAGGAISRSTRPKAPLLAETPRGR